jgi:predicted AlkP superfamily pyrophosphatase or phosphodiesterase
MRRIFFSLFMAGVLNSGLAQKTDLPYVILVSFDGFRSDYVERFNLPNFKKFIAEGAAADGMLPSFPSKTFPNHYTLVTGLYPGNHGLVDNSFYDPTKKKPYGMRIREAVVDPDYYGGRPLWRLARDNNVRSASYFWVGSELQEEGLHPDYFHKYEQSVPFDDRINEVIRWLRLPEKERPHMITLYFHSPDHESHKYGPLADETKKTVQAMDSLLGRFMQRIDSTRLPVNMILVSDHGMSELQNREETFIMIDEIIVSNKTIQVSNGGTQAHIYTSSPSQTDSLFAVLNKAPKNYRVVKRGDFPVRWHYDHIRSGDILLIANPGNYIISGTREKMKESWDKGGSFGAHGFDPDEVKEMAGIFYAKGPNIKKGIKVNSFRNIHVYPLIAKILNMKTQKIDGDFSILAPVYKR